MTTLLERDPTDRDTDEPALAHLAYVKIDPYTALCGARLLGIEAAPGAKKCEKCEELA